MTARRAALTLLTLALTALPLLAQNTASFAFNGGTDRVRVTDANALQPPRNVSALAISGTSLTVEAWVYVFAAPEPGRLFTIVARPADNGFLSDPFQTYGLLVKTDSVSLTTHLMFAISDGVTPIGGGNEVAVVDPNVLPIGSWTHVAGTYDGLNARLYVNGIEASSVPASFGVGTGSTGFYIGGTGGDNVRGLIDEVRLWNVTRSAAEISGSMNSTLTGSESGLAGYWPMETASSPAVDWTPDLTANSNDLQVQGAKLVAFPAGSSVQFVATNVGISLNAAVTNEPFAAAVFSNGWPLASPALVSGPAGMVLDGDTLRWTPEEWQYGNHEVIIEVTNASGTLLDTVYVYAELVRTIENDTRFDLTNRGKLGAFGRYGKGLLVNGQNGVYTADISVVDRNDEKYAGGLFTGANSFAPAEGFTVVPSMAVGFAALRTSFTDAWEDAASRIGLRVIQTSYIKSGVPDHRYTIVDYQFVNESGASLDDIFLQVTADFDVGVATNNVAEYDTALGLVYAVEADGATIGAAYGIQVVGGDRRPSGMAVWNVNDPLYVRSTGNLETFTPFVTTPSDVRGQISVGPYSAGVGDTMHLTVVYLGAPNLDQLRASAARAKQIVIDPVTIDTSPTLTETEPNGTAFTPNIITLGTRIEGTIDYQTDVDYFQFTLATEDTVQFIGMLGEGSNVRYRFELFNSSGNMLQSSGWYLLPEQDQYMGMILGPDTYSLRVLYTYNYASSYPTKRPFVKGSKEEELEAMSKERTLRTRVLTPTDTSGSYAILVRRFEPSLTRFGYRGAEGSTENNAYVYQYLYPGENSTRLEVEYGPSTAYGQVYFVDYFNAPWAQSPSILLPGLMPATTYHARFRASGTLGTAYGPDFQFTTAAPSPIWSRQEVTPGGGYYFLEAKILNDSVAFTAGSLVYRTTNGGTTWQDVSPAYTYYHYSRAIAFSSSGVGYSAGYGTYPIVKTNDLGNTWSSTYFGDYADLRDVAVDSTGQYIIGVGYGGLVVASSDFGATWSSSTIPSLNSFTSVDYVSSGVAVAGTDNATFYRTTDNGATWVDVGFVSHQIYGLDFVNTTTGFAATWGGIYGTTDGGLTWSYREGGTYYTEAIAMSDANNGLAVGYQGRIYRTTDGWNSFTIEQGGTTTELMAVATNGSIDMIAGGRGIVLRRGVQFEAEPNGDATAAPKVSYNATVRAVLNPDNDVDYYAFDGTAGDTVEFSTWVPPTSTLYAYQGTILQLFDPVGIRLMYSDWYTTDPVEGVTDRGIFILPTTGRYTVRVSDPRYGGGIWPNKTIPGEEITATPSKFQTTGILSTYEFTLRRRSAGVPEVSLIGPLGLFSDRTYIRAFLAPMGGATSGGIEYGDSPALGNFAPFEGQPFGGVATVIARASVTGLAPSTTYYYRATATNEYGAVVSDSLGQFTTPPAPEGWELRPTGTEAALLDVSFIPGGWWGMLVGSSGNIRRSYSNGQSWDSVAAFTANVLYAVYTPGYQEAIIAGVGNIIRRTTDGGQSWFTPVTPYPATGPSWYTMSFYDPSNGLIAGSGGVVLRTFDGGYNWALVSPIPGGALVRSIQMVSPSMFVAGLSTGMVAISIDAGNTWTTTPLYVSGRTPEAIAFFSESVGVVGALSDSVAYRTTDGGLSWTPMLITASTGYGLRKGTVSPDGTGYLAGAFGQVFISTDQGVSWTPTATGFSSTLYSVRSVEPNVVWGSGPFGVFMVRDQRPSDVTMYVDMRSAIQSGLFNPAIDTLALRGSRAPLQWTGFNHILTDAWFGSTDSIYQVSFSTADPGLIEYKFAIRHRGYDLWERASIYSGNRFADLPRGGVGYGHVFDDRAELYAPLTGQYDREVDVIGLYHLDEDTLSNVVWGFAGQLAVDQSSQSIHGGYNGVTMVDGRHGRARYFPGQTGTGITLEKGIFGSFGGPYSFTIEMWTKLDQYPAGNGAAVYSGGFYDAFLGMSTSGRLRAGIRNGSGVMVTDSSSRVLELNRWIHVAMQYDATGKILRAYIDGQLAMETALGVGFTTGSTFSQAFIGGGPGLGVYRGMIDEVRVSKRLVAPSEFLLPLPPATIGALSGDRRVLLSWSSSQAGLPVMRYRIYRGTDSVNVAVLDSASNAFISYEDTTAVNGAVYYYRIAPVDVSGFEGRRTVAVRGTPLPLPTITGSIPVRNSVQAPATGLAVVQFNTDIDTTSLQTSDVRVVGSLSGPMTITGLRYFPTPRLLEVALDTVFARGEEVEVTVRRGINNINGDSLAAPAVIRYRVAGVGGTGIMTAVNANTGTGNPMMVAAGDIDHDGDVDLVAANGATNIVTVYRNNGFGSFTSTNSLPTAGAPLGIVLADVNGDGWLDIATTNNAANTVTVWWNAGGNFASQNSIPVGTAPHGIAAGDLNGDGSTDLVTTNFGANTFTVLTNAGDGTFLPTSYGPVGTGPAAVAVADLNRDGWLDVVLTSALDGTARIYRNSGGSFNVQSSYSLGGGAYGLAIADMNADGQNDIVTGLSVTTNNLRIDLLNASGAITGTTTFTVGTDLRGVGVGDFNGDGLIDLAVSDYGANVVRVLANNGSGGYTELSTTTTGTNPWGLAVGDFDADGDLDVATGNQNSTFVTVLRNNVDNTAPAQVAGLTIRETSASVTLSWTASAETDVNRYVIFRHPIPSSSPGRYDSVGSAVTSYTDLSVTDSTFYAYYVKAVDVAGNESPLSFTRSATPHGRQSGEYSSTDTSTVLLLPFAEASGQSYHADATTNGQAGLAYGGHASVPGKYGAAGQFGGSQFVRFTSRPQYVPSGAFTVEAWVRPQAGGVMTIVRKDSNASSGYALTLATGGFPRFEVFQPAAAAQSPVALATGVWSHVAGVYSGTEVRVYVNGILASSSAASGPLTIAAGYLGIGAVPSTAPSDFFLGEIDEVRISSVARTPSEFNLQLTPRSLAASVAGTTINLSWQNGGGSAPLVRYRIYRGADSTSMAQIDSTTSTSYSNTDLDPATQYFYRVTAVDITGTETPQSFAATATTSSAPQQATVSTFAGSTAGNFDATGESAQFDLPEGTAFDALGNVYVADAGNGSVRKITPLRVVTTLATAMGTVASVAVDSVGNVFVASSTHHKIYRITQTGSKSTYAGSGNVGMADGDSTDAEFNAPSGLAFDRSGNLYVADKGNNVIRRISPSRFVELVTGSATGAAGFANGTGTTARFESPSGIALEPAGSFVVADAGNNAIRRLTVGIGGSVSVSTISGLDTTAGSTDGLASIARFNGPTGVAVDAAGNIFVADRSNHVLRRISPAGAVSTIAGAALASGFVDDLGAAARFSAPAGLAVDPTSTLVVADRDNHRIRRVVTNYVPSVFTADAASLTATGATLVGFGNPNGLTTSYYFEYGTSTAYGTQSSPASLGLGALFLQRTQAVSGLSANTTYHYRLVATNESGTTFGADRTFTTALPVPGVPTLVSPDSGATNVSVAPTLTWTGGTNAETYRLQVFLVDTTNSLVHEDVLTTGTSDPFLPLLHDTVYTWRVRSENVSGVSAYTTPRWFRTVVDTPDAPTLASPANNATDQPVSLTLSWNASPRATSYRLQVSANSSFSVLSYDDSTLTGTSAAVNGLANLTTYYWRVSAKNVGGVSPYSDVRQFTTIIAVPAEPALLSPADSAINQPTVLTLSWTAATRAATYHLQVGADAGFSTLIMEDSTITSTSRQVGTLSNAATYYWRVRAKNVGGSTAYTPARRFTTIVSSPDVPALAGPDSGATSQPLNVQLRWRPAARADRYHVQLSTSNTFSSTLVNDSTLTDTVRTLSALANDASYFWRVRSLNAGGSSAYSPVWTFRTVVAVPDVPTLDAPADSATDLPVTIPFSWTAALRATSYRLEISADPSFATLVHVDSTLTGTTKGVGPLAYSTRFFWRVRAQNVGGSSAYSGVRTFRTIIEPPSVPVLTSPDTTSTTIPTMAPLVWRSAARAVSYRVQVSLFQNFGVNVTDQSGLTDTSLSVGTLFNDTTYYWRVSATNAGGTSAFSAPWKFRTIVAAPDAPSLALPLDGVGDQPVSTTFSWSPANRATTYRLEVSLQSDLSTLFFIDSTITGTSRQVSLAHGTTYYWRVRARNVGGAGAYSAVRSFTTIVQSPDVPVLFAPDSAAQSMPTTVDLRWRRSSRASSYQVQVSLISNFSTTVTNLPAHLDTSLTVGPLTNDTEYFWRISATNAGGVSAFSPVWRFRTVVAIPDVPATVSPADNGQNVATSVTFVWSAAARAATYRLQVSADPTFATGVQEVGNIAGTSQLVTGLAHDVTHYWRVRAENAGGVSGYSTLRTFKTVVAPPATAPTLASPADNAQGVAPTTSFSWNGVAGAVNYHFQIGTDNTFPTTTYQDSTLTATTVTPPTLTFDTQFFWRVRAKNAGGNGPWSAVRVLRTAPAVALASMSPSPVDFGSVEAGSGSADRTVTLTNSGGIALNVTSVTLEGVDAASFNITSGSGSFSVNPGATRQIIVRFTPNSRGPRQAMLVVRSNDQRYLAAGLADTLNGFATDNTPPYNPSLSVSANPSSWTRTLPITITWTPEITDVSDVTHVWIAPNAIPTVGSPGTRMAMTSQSFTVPTPVQQGVIPVRFYFEDGAGNKNPDQHYTAIYRYDAEEPEITHDTTSVPEVTVQSGVASGAVTISAQASDTRGGASGIQSFTLEYRRVTDPSFSATSMNGGSAQIPATTFVQNGGPVGVDYRLVAVDSAGNREATRVFSIRVRSIDAPPPQPTPLVSVAALAPGTDLVKAYRLFSIPYNLDDKRPSQIFPLSTNLGPHEQDGVAYANWRLQRFNGGTKEDYEGFKDQSALTPGSAFFLIVRNSNKRITVGAGSIVNAQAMNDVGISLQTGWNLVGNPLLRDIAIDSLQVTGGATIQQRASFTGSGAASGWDLNPTTLKQWEGLAIRVSAPTQLLFRTIGSQPGIADPDRPVGRLQVAEAVSDEGATQSWYIPFAAYRTDNDMTDLGDAIGMTAGASEGVDRYDHFQPPFVGTRNVALYFENEGEAMMQDIRPLSERGGVWEMKVVTGDEGAKIRLATGGAVVLPNPDFEAFLIDLDQRMAFDLRTTSELTINSMNGRRNFRVVVGRKDYVIEQSAGVDLYPKEFQLYANYPNPFNPETMIRYTVADRGQSLSVSLKVYDMLGREVAMLVDREQPAGYYEVSFNGAGLSSGPYFYRLQVTDASGRAVFARVQKMALIK